jgi:hypothetical protein
MNMNEPTLQKMIEHHLKMVNKYQVLDLAIRQLNLEQEMLPSGYVKISFMGKPFCVVWVDEVKDYAITIGYDGELIQTEETTNIFEVLKRARDNV